MKVKKILTIMVVCFSGLVFWPVMAKATLVNSNSLIEDNIEYYMQTDKAVYDLGENVQMLYRVTNVGNGDATFEFFSGPVDDRSDFIVEKDGEVIWDNLNRPATGVLTSFILSPLESRDFTWPWDMVDFSGNQVMPGNYDVTGVLSNLRSGYEERYVPVSVQIEIIPEPCTILLLGLGTILLRKRR